MRKYLILLIIFISFQVHAGQTIIPVISSNSVTNANLTVVLTDGSASVDFGSAVVSADSLTFTDIVEVKDSAGRMIWGYAKTAGAGTVVNVVSGKGGATANWTYKDAAFDNDDDSGYTYRILSSNKYSESVASVTETSGHLYLAFINGGSMFWSADNDYSAYAGTDAGSTPYMFVFNGTNTIIAYGGAAGGGVALGADGLAAWDLTSDWSVVNCNGTINDSNTFTNTAASGCVTLTDSGIITPGKLYKATLNGSPSAGTLSFRGNSSDPIWCSGNTCNGYAAAVWNKIIIYNAEGGIGATTDITSMTLEPVTDVAATGLHLHSTKNGTDLKIAYKRASYYMDDVTNVSIYRAL